MNYQELIAILLHLFKESVILMVVQIIIALPTLVLTLAGSWLIARKYGDVAAQHAAERLEKQRVTERRERILTALDIQSRALPEINTYNQTATAGEPRHLMPMPYPVLTFERATFSEDSVSLNDRTIVAVTQYWVKARELNVLVEGLAHAHFTFTPGGADRIRPALGYLNKQINEEMSPRIQKLRESIEAELASQTELEGKD